MPSPRAARTSERSGRRGSGSRPLARRGRIERLPWPLSGWTATRDLPEPPEETFREWWRRERGDGGRCGRPRRSDACGHRTAAARRGGRAAEQPATPAPPSSAASGSALADRPRRGGGAARLPAALASARAPRSWPCSPSASGEYRASVHRAPARRAARRAGGAVPRARSAPRWRCRRPARRLAPGRRRARARRPASRRTSSTGSTAPSPAARSPSPRPARSCSTAAPARAAGRSRSCPTTTSAWSRQDADRGPRARGRRAARAGRARGPAAHVRLRALGHLGHRAEPGRGRARPAHAARGGRRD